MADYVVTVECCWYWRKINNVKATFASGFRIMVGFVVVLGSILPRMDTNGFVEKSQKV